MRLMSSAAEEDLHAADCDGPERAALLVELGQLELREGRASEANRLFQEAFDLQYKGLDHAGATKASAADSSTPENEAAAQSKATPAPATPAAAAPAPADGSPAAARAGSSDSGGDSDAGGWDASDDWEPDVSQLQAATSFGRQRPATTGGIPPPSSSSSNRAGPQQTEPASGRWQSRSCGGWGGSSAPSPRVRGRGESKCGLDSDSEDELELRANAAHLPHIVEVFGLHRGVRSSHLEDFLLDFAWGDTGPKLRWVDDEHALAVFPCAEAAQALLDNPQRTYKVRPYSQASSGALQVDVEDLAPPRGARPKTTTAVARRLISNALGNREVRDRAAEKELADMRRANKQERQTRQQGLAQAWGDD